MKKTLEFLYSLRAQGSAFGTERMEELTRRLNYPQNKLSCIHVAGTNGKGSVCAMLESIYRAHGYSVGLFTSPHLVELGERIRVDSQIMSFSEIEYWLEKIFPICREMERETSFQHPTFFELMTAIAFLTFDQKAVDLAIVETGLGGRLDSTNVINPMVSVITTIGFDHCEMLGNTLTQIAREKAGIIKPGIPVVVGSLDDEAREEVVKIALQRNSPVHCVADQTSMPRPTTNLQGEFQRRNAALAQKTTELISEYFPVDNDKILSSLHKVKLPGRWQTISEQPKIIVDACHNGQGALVSKELWSKLPSNTTVWFAACGLDRAGEVLSSLAKIFRSFVLFELNQPRSCSHQQMLSTIQSLDVSVKTAHEENIPEYYQRLSSQSTVLITGSIYLVSSAISAQQSRSSAEHIIYKNWQDCF